MAKKKKQYATHVTTPDGERIYVSALSKDELDKKVFELKMALGAGLNVTDETTFASYARAWLETYKKKTLRPTSYTLSSNMMELHVIPFFSNRPLRAIKPMHIQYFLNSLSDYSKSTQQKCFQLVQGVFRSAVDDDLISRSPVRSSHRIHAEDPPEVEPLTDEQARRLLTALEGTKAYTFCLIALSTGMRRGEILGLMWEDVDLEENVIHVRHNKALPMNENDAPVSELLKTEAARRDLPIGSVLREHLLSLREATTSQYVLCNTKGESLSKSAFRAMWSAIDRRTAGKGNVERELGEQYGRVKVTLDFDVHPHLLRHTYITKLFEKGLDLKQVQYLAGHSKPEMTLRVYTHYIEKQRAAATHSQVVAALDFLTESREEVRV